MSKTLGEYSLNDIAAIGQHIPGVGNWPRRLLANSYEDFVQVLYDDIDSIVAELQLNPELVADDGEDRLSVELKRTLKHMGYIATHDEKIGGHSDIVVKNSRNFLWIGEAKVHSSYDYLYQGFQQLTTRYSTGDKNQDRGGMLIYIRTMDAAGVIAQWREHLRSKELIDYSEADCAARAAFTFFTTHKHDRSGEPFHVRHVGIILGFDPKDRRKRRAKKGSVAKAD